MGVAAALVNAYYEILITADGNISHDNAASIMAMGTMAAAVAAVIQPALALPFNMYRVRDVRREAAGEGKAYRPHDLIEFGVDTNDIVGVGKGTLAELSRVDFGDDDAGVCCAGDKDRIDEEDHVDDIDEIPFDNVLAMKKMSSPSATPTASPSASPAPCNMLQHERDRPTEPLVDTSVSTHSEAESTTGSAPSRHRAVPPSTLSSSSGLTSSYATALTNPQLTVTVESATYTIAGYGFSAATAVFTAGYV